MQDSDRRIYEMFVRVRDLGADRVDVFPDGSTFRAQFDALKALVTELQGHIGEQDSGKRVAKQGSSSKAAAREKLRESLAAINRTARTMDMDTPGLAEAFQMPARNDTALAGAARAFHTNATPLKARFLQNEMPADFLEQLQANLTAFEATVNSQNLGTEQHVAATAHIDDLLARGQKIVKQLDTLIRNKFPDDRALLTLWNSSSHVERSPRTEVKKPTPQ
ncbi:MAG: hypothetical protein QOD00_1987 [Blastocatellia bacterium]|nr:hypothetical protein [Blastocatellia bacterium]